MYNVHEHSWKPQDIQYFIEYFNINLIIQFNSYINFIKVGRWVNRRLNCAGAISIKFFFCVQLALQVIWSWNQINIEKFNYSDISILFVRKIWISAFKIAETFIEIESVTLNFKLLTNISGLNKFRGLYVNLS